MENLVLVGISMAVSSTVMTLCWMAYIRTDEASFVDVIWALGTAVVGIYFLQENQGNPNRATLLSVMLVLWSARLSIHLILRLRKRGEDSRYLRMKAKWGEQSRAKFFWFFQAQALFVVIFALPFLVAGSSPTTLGGSDILASILWITGFIGGTIADWQLESFKSRPGRKPGDVCKEGLWNYTRHPNYFFEWVLWSSYALVGIQAGGGLWLLLIPVVVFTFLTKLTGMPFIECPKLAVKGSAYAEYVANTSPFFPWIPGQEKIKQASPRAISETGT